MEYYKNLSLESLPNEVWKDIPMYEGRYMVSTLSRIKGKRRRVVSNHKTQNRHLKEMILKQRLDSKGYLYVCLNDASKHIPKNFRVHRLFAQSFIPNPEKKPDINHKNGVRNDNRFENLEWCTRSENVLHSRRVLGSKGGASYGEIIIGVEKLYVRITGSLT